ncbi:MAG: DUF3368 domain-containing protein [Desulfarculaceae bacterium]|nr:DUF3368 domain-containing protein [Desulfarculaceae bacterium]
MREVCNTTPLIALSSLGSLDLLSDIYGEIFIPEAVFREIDHGGNIAVPRLDNKKWIKIISDIQTYENSLLYQLDIGERQVVLNALHGAMDLVLIDDRVARNIAELTGLKVKGTLGVLVEAKRRNLVKSFRSKALEMKANGIYFSERLIDEIAEKIDE